METRFLSTTSRTTLISSSRKLLRRTMTMNSQSVIIIVIIVLAGLIVITSIVWIFLAYRYRQQNRVQRESKTAYRKLQKPRQSLGSEDSKTEDIKDEQTTSNSISRYLQERGVDVEAQAHELDGESLYPEDDRTTSFLPGQLLPRSASRGSTHSTSILGRKTSLSSNRSYERHVSEYVALVSPELQTLMSEESPHPHPHPHLRPESSRDQNQYSWEELLFPRAQYPQPRLPADVMPSSPYQQQQPHLRSYSISESRSSAPHQRQSSIPTVSISQQQDTSLTPPIPRKSSRRGSCPTSIDKRVTAPTLIVTRPSTSTLDLTDKYELDGITGKWQRYEPREQQGQAARMLTVPQRITSARKSRSAER